MELIYIYIEEFRNIKKAGIALSDKFKVQYDDTSKSISIIKNSDYINIYPDNIVNINALVGMNGVGKTNIIDLIGMKIDDRNANNDEIEFIYEKRTKPRLGQKVKSSIKHAKYFMIYHLNSENNTYIIEGNFISAFENLFSNEIQDQSYFESKSWFSFVCKNTDNKMEYISNTNEWQRTYSTQNNESNDTLPCIISFRGNYNDRIYTYNSYMPSDDYKISIPRRISHTSPNLLKHKITYLMDMIKTNTFSMYKNSSYHFYLEATIDYSTDDKPFKEIYKTLNSQSKAKAKLIEDFLCNTYYQSSDNKNNLKNNLFASINATVSTYSEAIEYYKSVFKTLLAHYILLTDKKDFSYSISRFDDFLKALDNPNINITNNSIHFEMNASTDISGLENVINIIDDDYRFESDGLFRLFSNFFISRIDYLSDGEAYFLGLLSSIKEQIDDIIFCYHKKHFIMLFDEPETSMHPELARSFIDYLVSYLSTFCDKTFQIIIATHSPFILSDLLPGNVQMLSKLTNNQFKSEVCSISTFGANIHEILASGFFMSSTIGEFSKKTLNQVINVLSDKNNSELPPEKIHYIISIIGEPIIKRKLSEMYDKRYQRNNNLREIESIINELHNPTSSIKEIREKVNEYLDQIEEDENNESIK